TIYGRPQKMSIEWRIVHHERQVADASQDLRQQTLDVRGILQLAVINAGQLPCARRKRTPGIDEGGHANLGPLALRNDDAHFTDAIPALRRKAAGLEIQRGDRQLVELGLRAD